MNGPVRAILLATLLAALGCKRAPDPLAGPRAQCASLAAAKELKTGITIEDCAKELHAADPAVRVLALLDQTQALVAAGKGKAPQTGAQRQALAEALQGIANLGRPAVAPALARMTASKDSDLRIALARVLVALCIDDCAQQKWDCIVPALLEGVTPDRPQEVRTAAVRGLNNCTQQLIGDDPAAWRKWYAGTMATASR